MIIEFKISPIRKIYSGYDICKSLTRLWRYNENIEFQIPFIGNLVKKILINIFEPIHDNSIWVSGIHLENLFSSYIRNRLNL
jgi:hypothetical protein